MLQISLRFTIKKQMVKRLLNAGMDVGKVFASCVFRYTAYLGH